MDYGKDHKPELTGSRLLPYQKNNHGKPWYTMVKPWYTMV